MFTEGGDGEGPKDIVLIAYPDGTMLCDPSALAAAPPPKLRRRALPIHKKFLQLAISKLRKICSRLQR
jgi:hypothetical protein